MKNFGNMIYAPESASGEAISKVESHTPKIEAPKTVKADQPFEVKAAVGPHPNTVEHSIRRIEVYFHEDERPFNPILLGTADFTPIYVEPTLKLVMKVKKSGTIFVLGYCNLHGLWEGKAAVKVE